ncbi:hypothetical protein [Parasedimentitalea marina]|uniref:hypothetical protein n=1 Tax=Parasedimentitalea marina TaxID=2483033 RepID=UPI0030845863
MQRTQADRPKYLAGPIGNDLVEIDIRGGATRALGQRYDKIVVVLASNDFITSAGNGCGKILCPANCVGSKSSPVRDTDCTQTVDLTAH